MQSNNFSISQDLTLTSFRGQERPVQWDIHRQNWKSRSPHYSGCSEPKQTRGRSWCGSAPQYLHTCYHPNYPNSGFAKRELQNDTRSPLIQVTTTWGQEGTTNLSQYPVKLWAISTMTSDCTTHPSRPCIFNCVPFWTSTSHHSE